MDSETPEFDLAGSSREKSGNTRALATRQTRRQNNATASPPHTECKPRSRRKRLPYQDQVEARSVPPAPPQPLPPEQACCASHPPVSSPLRATIRAQQP